jgi:hypothetical protein
LEAAALSNQQFAPKSDLKRNTQRKQRHQEYLFRDPHLEA